MQKLDSSFTIPVQRDLLSHNANSTCSSKISLKYSLTCQLSEEQCNHLTAKCTSPRQLDTTFYAQWQGQRAVLILSSFLLSSCTIPCNIKPSYQPLLWMENQGSSIWSLQFKRLVKKFVRFASSFLQGMKIEYLAHMGEPLNLERPFLIVKTT